MPISRHLTALPLLAMLASCYGDHYDVRPSVLVVEGHISADGFPEVFLTKSVVLQSNKEYSADDLGKQIVEDAVVKISDGDTTVTLIGRMNDEHSIPFYYTTSWMKGEVGKTYTLDVTCAGYHATATATVPEPVELESVKVTKLSGDQGYKITGHVGDIGSTGYYKIFVSRGAKNDLVSPSMGLYTKENLGTGCDIPINCETTVWSMLADTTVTSRDVHVCFCAIDDTAYRFWREDESQSTLRGNPLFQVESSLPTNITGGIGYWQGWGMTEYDVRLN